MKRDLDLVREILLRVEELPPGRKIANIQLHVEGFESDTITEHIHLLVEARLIEAQAIKTLDNSSYIIKRLTWEGHDFVANAKNPEIWKKFISVLKDKDDYSTALNAWIIASRKIDNPNSIS